MRGTGGSQTYNFSMLSVICVDPRIGNMNVYVLGNMAESDSELLVWQKQDFPLGNNCCDCGAASLHSHQVRNALGHVIIRIDGAGKRDFTCIRSP